MFETKQLFGEAEQPYLKGIAEQRRTGAKIEWSSLDFGTMLVKEQQFAKAKPFIDEAIAINPISAQAYFELGSLLEKKGDYRTAIDELKAATQLDPKLASAHYRLASLYRKVGEQSKSQAELRYFQQLSAPDKEK